MSYTHIDTHHALKIRSLALCMCAAHSALSPLFSCFRFYMSREGEKGARAAQRRQIDLHGNWRLRSGLARTRSSSSSLLCVISRPAMVRRPSRNTILSNIEPFLSIPFSSTKKGANSKMAEYWQRQKRGVLTFQYFFVLCLLLHERNSFYCKKKMNGVNHS